MLEPAEVTDLIRRARSGDEAASTELVAYLEPFIQRVVRRRMGRAGHRGAIGHDFGSADVCQSVFRSLFRGLKNNRYRLDQPGDLERLLQVMVRFNLATKARKASVRLRELMHDFEQGGWLDPGPPPDQAVVDEDLIEAVQEQFSEEELEILMMRIDDVAWAEIGRKIGCAADTARFRLSRAIVRVRARMPEGDRDGV